MLLNVDRATYQKVTHTHWLELAKDAKVFDKLLHTDVVEEDLQYIVIIEDRVWQEFKYLPTAVNLARVQHSFLENAVFKFESAESTAKLLIPDEVYKAQNL